MAQQSKTEVWVDFTDVPPSEHQRGIRCAKLKRKPAERKKQRKSPPVVPSPIASLRAFHEEGPWGLCAVRKGKIEFASFGPATEAECAQWTAERNSKANIYSHVGVIREGLTKKATKQDIALVTWLHVDCDPRAGEDLDAERERIRNLLLGYDPLPTCVIDSGRGYWAYWRLREPIITDSDVAIARAESYNLGLELALGGDSCHDISRIARLPGTINLKTGREAEVYLLDESRVYDLDVFPQAPMSLPPSNGKRPIRHRSIGLDVPRINDIDDLDEWKVPGRVKVIIAQGHDPDNPKARDNSRSAWLFDVICQLIRADAPMPVISSVCTDPKFKISESVLEDSNPQRFLSRQIQHAQKKVAEDPLMLSPGTPLVSARKLKKQCPNLMHSNGDFVDYNGVHYEVKELATMRSEVSTFLDKAVVNNKGQPFSVTMNKVTEVVSALKDDTHRPRNQFEPPCFLDGREDDPRDFVVFPNGILNLRTNELLSLTPNLFTMNALDFAYDPKAPKPERFLQFLDELWPRNAPKALLQEWCGYCISFDTSLQKALLLIGPPRAGKGVLCHVLANLVGKCNVSAPTLNSFGGPFGLQPLIGKTLAVVNDVRIGGRTDREMVAETLLRVIGEDYVDVHRKHRGVWSGRLPTRFIFTSNELPRFADASGALANRFLPLQLTRSFLGHEDPELLKKLLAELPGILLWAIKGYQRLQDRKPRRFELPKGSSEIVQALGDLASPEGSFLRDRCTLKAGVSVSKADLYAAWKLWCRDRDVDCGSPEWFSSKLVAAGGGKIKRGKPRPRRVPSFLGVELREEESNERPY